MKLKHVFENEFDKGFVDLYVNVTRQMNPNISRDEIKNIVEQCGVVMAHNVRKMFSSKTEPVHGRYYSSEKFPVIVSYHMFGVKQTKETFWDMDNLEQNLKAISKALAMMTVFLYETDTKLKEVMVISDEKYDNNNESLFYSCYYRNIKTFDDLYNRWKTSECTALMARAIRYVLEQKEDDRPLYKTYISISKPDFIGGKTLRTCRYIAFDATTVSTATLEQKKADKKYLTELVAIKLKAIKEIKENPELLKHLKISTVTYVPTGAHVVVEWKEGFVYSDL